VSVHLRPATLDDAAVLAAIYEPYVLSTTITFEEEVVSVAAMRQRLADTQMAQLPWLVCEEQGAVVGYAYAGPWHKRSAFRYTVEGSVYLRMDARGRGLGLPLYSALIHELRERGYHSVIGGIALPNEASVALHEKLGFQKAAHYSEAGYKFQRWIDIGYWQLRL
jgi:L-amino acid N-acyltransferase YncA